MSDKKHQEDLQPGEAPAVDEVVTEPPRYAVCILNDDYTPMEFVVEILELFFTMDHSKATQTMLQVHQSGKAVCGCYSRDVAETKVIQVIEYARLHQHPLMCEMEAMS